MTKQLLIATRKGLFTYTRNAKGWTISNASFVGDHCPIVKHDPRNGFLYAALKHGHFGPKMHRSEDGGKSWTEIANPTYPEPPEGNEPKENPMSGTVTEWKLRLVWALEPGGVDHPNRLWCGTIPGGLFLSDDLGESWELNRPLWDDPRRESWFGGGFDDAGIHSVCVDPRNSDHLAVGVSCGGVWITEDGGGSWTLGANGMRAEYMPPEQAHDPIIQDPHLVSMCRDHPDVMWVQHHNGIFRSTDYGSNWTELECKAPSNFGFAVAAHPSDPNTAWFVPAVKDEKRYAVDGKVVVTRTRDGGESFAALGKGLPEQDAYDIVYRHALDVDETGEVLAFGSTTGNLWLTEDGGDAWVQLSSTLPPIYAVRFVKS